jgi:hypothetical protein
MSISTREEGEQTREGDAEPSFVRTALCFLLVFAIHLFHQETFLSVNAAEVACFPYRLAGEMVRKNVMTLYLGPHPMACYLRGKLSAEQIAPLGP